MMDRAEAAIIERYAEALQFSLAYFPSTDVNFDRRIRDELWDAGTEIERRGLAKTSQYDEAVLRADRIAREIRTKQAASMQHA